jgi:16S rRNA pseudouridine516 synthase
LRKPTPRKLTLDRILQSQGFGTRRECQALIRSGEVAVGGSVATHFDEPLDPRGLAFSVRGEAFDYHEHLYLALNKPAGYECSRKPSHHPGVLSLLPRQFALRETQPVGRLDYDTTGLLLLSDDGAFIHAHTSPKRQVPKIYVALTRDPVTPALVGKLLGGVQLEDEPAPLAAKSCRQLDDHRLEIVLEQGKYHQVKRMLAAAGNHCAALDRIAIGRLRLAGLGLAEGGWCHLDPAQRALLAAA